MAHTKHSLMKKNLQSLLVLTFLFFTIKNNAQIAGAYNIPGSFPSIAAAITTLNISGVAGPVTINIPAGYTETAPPGGFKLFTAPGSSAANYIVFQKSGAGANPLITAYTGTATPTSNIQDGVFWLIGSDYVTIDGLDIFDPNTTNPATMEFGYGFYKTGTTNGCQYNTIKNCVITLNRINNAYSSNSFIAPGSRGIDLSSCHYQGNVNAGAPTSSSGENSFNKFYGNVIRNCNTGIALMAYSNPGFVYVDHKNDVGGLLASTGNTVVNFGGPSGGGYANGILANGQTSLNISFNSINNNNGSGSNPLMPTMGIALDQAVFGEYSITNNTIAINSDILCPWGIWNTTNSSTVTIKNNLFSVYNAPNANLSSASHWINSTGPGGVVSVNSNTFQNASVGSTTLGGITVTHADTAKITNNIIRNVTGTLVRMVLIECSGTKQNISNNLIDNITYTSTSTYNSTFLGIQSDMALDVALTSNTITNVKGNSLVGIEIPTQSYNATALISKNTISNFGCTPGTTYGMTFTGINYWNAPPYTTTVNVSVLSNTIYSITSTGTGTTNNTGGMYGILVYNGSSTYTNTNSIANIGRNKIYTLVSSGTSGIHTIRVNFPATIHNNVIGDIRLSNSNGSLSMIGINVESSPLANVYYNSIYLNNTTNTAPNSGSCAFYAFSSAYTLKNNIFVNTSIPAGTGKTMAIRDATSTFTALSAYGSSSNNNLLYTGTPGPANLILSDVSGTYSTLALFKSYVAPREAQSVTENPPFITTNGALPNTLNIDPSIATQIDGGAIPVAGITTDFAGAARNATTPDIGAWEGPFTKAMAPGIVSSGFSTSACNLTNRTMTLNISDASGVATGVNAPRLYYRVNFAPSYSSVQGILSSGTTTNGVWSFNLNYSAVVSDVIRYFVAMQDQSGLTGVVLVPANGGAATDVNNITIPPNPANTYTIQSAPTISAPNATICAGTIYTINPTGAASYSFSGGSATVSPVTNTSYVITGFSSGGCASTNTLTININVLASPNISVNSGTICAGQSFVLVPSGATTYTFSNGTATVTPNTTSSYYVSSGNSLGCIRTVTSTVVVNPLPPLVAVANEYAICEGKSTVLHASGANTFSWEPIGSAAAHVTVTPAITTAYTITGTNATGCSTSSVLTINVAICLGVKEAEADQLISVYPNPSSGKINIRLQGTADAYTLKIYNVAGQLIHSGLLKDKDSLIDLNSQSKGIYFIHIYSNETLLKQEKIILE